MTLKDGFGTWISPQTGQNSIDMYHQNIYLSDIFSQYVLSASSDSVARLWSLKTGELKREYQAHQKPLTSLAFRDLHGVRNMSS